MKEHPGHFWPCLWLFLILFALYGVQQKIEVAAGAISVAIINGHLAKVERSQ